MHFTDILREPENYLDKKNANKFLLEINWLYSSNEKDYLFLPVRNPPEYVHIQNEIFAKK